MDPITSCTITKHPQSSYSNTSFLAHVYQVLLKYRSVVKCERRRYPVRNEKQRISNMYHKHHHTGYLSKYVNSYNQTIILLKYAGSCIVLKI